MTHLTLDAQQYWSGTITWEDVEPVFTSGEFDSPDQPGTGHGMSMALIGRLWLVRTEIRFPVIVTSGYRTEAHNRKVGGAPRSYHVSGLAADVTCPGVDLKEFFLACEAVGFRGLGIYPEQRFVHVDLGERGRPQRWTKRNGEYLYWL